MVRKKSVNWKIMKRASFWTALASIPFTYLLTYIVEIIVTTPFEKIEEKKKTKI
jgi:hypothetical protein